MNELTAGAALAWRIAALEAGGAGHPRIDRGQALIGVLSLEKARDAPPPDLATRAEELAAIQRETGRLDEVLAASGATAAQLRRRVRMALGTGEAARSGGSISRTEACKLAFLRADELANGAPVSALHLFAALLLEPDPLLMLVLREGQIDGRALAQAALRAASMPAPPHADLVGAPAIEDRPMELVLAEAASPRNAEPTDTPALDRYGRDLTRLAARGELGPFVGRRDILLELIQTLARSSKNNPLLVGEAGVGKTAIVEALAVRAAQQKDAVLSGKRIVELSVGALLGGTQYRGELEERIAKILKETTTHPEIVVFIDELHTLVGAGRVGEGGADAASLLKPALARGDLRCIGATTLAEFRQYLEPDEALERRFARIDVPEPTRDEAVEMVRGLRARWEAHHGVRFDEAALAAAVDLSIRFDPDHRLPDKAVDLLDQAAARARVPMLSLYRAPDGALPSPVQLAAAVPVDARLVAEVLAEKRGLPVELVVAGGGGARLLQLPEFLSQRLVGQENAVQRVCDRLRLAHAGLQQGSRPLGVFLFLGPTGVGKTETARLLAEFLFGNRSQMIRIDMSELMEEHSVAKLIGSPPGYVGHQEDGRLTGALRTRPYSIVLLDEAEKAHSRVFDLFLQLFDEGRLTDAKGRTADGRHAVFVMTSNLGSGASTAPVVGFAPGQGPGRDPTQAALQAATDFFRPELMNRIDEVVVFRPLDREATRRIAGAKLRELCEVVRAQHQVLLEVSTEAEVLLAETGFSATHGARELARTIERMLSVPLSQLVLSGELARRPVWRVQVEGAQLALSPA